MKLYRRRAARLGWRLVKLLARLVRWHLLSARYDNTQGIRVYLNGHDVTDQTTMCLVPIKAGKVRLGSVALLERDEDGQLQVGDDGNLEAKRRWGFVWWEQT